MKLGERRDNEWSYTVLVKYRERRYIPLDAECSGWMGVHPMRRTKRQVEKVDSIVGMEISKQRLPSANHRPRSSRQEVASNGKEGVVGHVR